MLECKADDMKALNKNALQMYDDLVDQYKWTQDDARCAYVAHIADHCNNTVLALLTTADCLTNPEWLARRIKKGNERDFTIIVENHDKFIRKNTFLNAWIFTENALRRIRCTIIGGHVRVGIMQLCRDLFLTDLSHPRADEFLELIALVTRIRNTSHNDFSYYPDKGGNENLPYRDQSFAFIIGQQLDFFTWDFIRERIADLLELYKEIVATDCIKDITHIPSH